MDAPIGKRGSEACKVLSYLPKKYLSFSWNAPPQFEEVRSSTYNTWVVIEFNVLSNQQTELILTHLGWPKDERWNPVFDYFDKAWDQVFMSLSKHDVPLTLSAVENKKVTSIGGIFFKCKDPKKMREWYQTNLGLSTNNYGSVFEWRHGADSSKKRFTQWSPFNEKTKYFEPSTKDYMINYRVENIEKLVQQLKENNVTVTDNIETYDYGKFVHIMDPEGNKIELWEPNDIVYENMGKQLQSKTVK
jgi:predicted enzyme related to lactoylglutathione lyase